ncbi:LamG-like jellyroll fold domain-containing protein [Algibacter lectus]|uniref:LamG-like jellyroll fold domain-containing protein n=1 Tax=Algibacter lectus TaxID=221126 RepID=UPI0026F090FB|nr:LamG-like jellyroll fold domain-containing protein [Algibacter lectus]MDO7136699.1 LamG-like jellyroll fold domain-containing protein [Algibacter lectus]
MKKIYFFILLFLSINYVKAQSQADYLNFDGVDDSVSLTNTYSSVTDFTIEAWIKTDTDGIVLFSISGYDSSYLAVTNGKLTYTTGRHGYGGFILTSNQNVDDNTWHHVAFSTSSINTNGQGNLYIDGVLDNSGSFGGYTVPMGSLIVGGVNTSHFSGSIDELRIWNVIRTATEINNAKSSEIQCNEPGLVAYYQFNKGIDAGENTNVTHLTDITGNGNNGTLTNFALTGTSSNWLAGSPITSLSSPPDVVSPIAYAQDDTATALTATPGTNGISLLWYTDVTGGTGSVNAPTPSTTTLGNTTYYVSSVNANGCESERAEIVVTVALPGTHLNFDGVDDYITLPVVSTFDLTNNMTIEFWMKSGVTPEQWDTLIAKGDYSWRIALNTNGTLNFAGSGGFGDVSSTVSVIDNTWHHVAATYNGIEATIYIDGSPSGSVAGSGDININNTIAVAIGENLDMPGRYYTGNLDEVRIWNIARTAEQINGSKNCELQGTETGLIAYYNFNQGANSANNTSETTAIDATGANNGTLTNFDLTSTTSNWLANSPVTTGSIIPSEATVTTPVTYSQGDTASPLTATTGTNGTGLFWYTTETGGTGTTTAPTPDTTTVSSTSYWVSSVNTNGCESERTEIVVTVVLPATHLNFGGLNDYVDCGNDPSLQITGNTITLEAYVKFNTFGSEHWLGNIINKAAPTSSGYMLRAGGNGAVNFVVANSGWHELTTPDNTITLDTWFHIAGVYNGTTSKIYIDGIEIASTNIAMGNIGNSNFNVNIGRDPQDTNRGLDASLDEVRIWNIARTAEQINGSKNCELQGTETGLVAYYNFNQGADSSTNTSETTAIDVTGTNNGTLTNFDLTGTTSNWLASSPVTTGSIIPSEATVTTPVTYNQGDTASPLTATTGSNGTALLWYTTETNGTGTTTAPTPGTTTAGSTSYWVSSTNDNGCESEKTEIVVTVESTLSSNNFDISNKLKIYPNPATNTITIDVDNLTTAKLQVLDLTGKIINNETLESITNSIDITKYPSGVYMFKIITTEGTTIKKVIKQ